MPKNANSLIGLFLSLFASAASAQTYPSPTYNQITVQNGATIGGTARISGATSLNGGGSLIGTFNGPTILPTVTPTLANYAISGLPSVGTSNRGEMVFITNCVNGNEVSGSGCPGYVNNAGTWITMPSPPSASITIGGQQLRLGGNSSNQGNGGQIQLATGSYVVGHALAYDNNGNAVDSGVVPGGGGGGGGTVTGAPQNSIAYYSNAGTSTVVAGLSIANNAVLATNGSGVPAEVTVLPSGLTLPGGLLSSPTLTGTISIAAATYTGTQTYVASNSSIPSMVIPAGTPPSSPGTGALWATSAGLFYKASSVSTPTGPFIGPIVATSPLGGNGSNASPLTCSNCATTTNGGSLSGVLPISVSAGGAISLGGQPLPITLNLGVQGASVTNGTITIFDQWLYAGNGTLNSVSYRTDSGSFAIAYQINGSNVAGCNGITVSSASTTTSTCTSGNTIGVGQALKLLITASTNSPTNGVLSLNMTKPAL